MIATAIPSPSSSDLSSSGVYDDFDIGFGEIIEYTEDADTFGEMGFASTFTSASYSASFDDAPVYSSSFDRKGKSSTIPEGSQKEVDRYHPDNSKREIVEYVQTNQASSGQIPTANLMHSSEQWSNYHDLCESVRAQLHRDGYSNARVECVEFGTQWYIMYDLH